MAQPFKLYNTISKQLEEFKPIRPGHVGLYVCGMTVYDHIHVGHARAMVVFDTFVRYLRYRDWDVTFVRNFTDVDDKIIDRAQQRNIEPLALAEEFIAAFHKDVGALGLETPDQEPRVSENIPVIIEMIEKLIAAEHAYVAEGTVWFAVKSLADYGKLSRCKVDELRSADTAGGKREAADFALWKAAKQGEVAWDSPWGSGRPGWHIECSAMGCNALGTTMDIHGGGLDLVFPHHENEIAQSEAANGATFANYWMHNGLLNMASGQKMGKSLGNVINVRDALAEYPAEALRLYYLQNHYRSPLPWDGEALSSALSMLARLYEARENAEAMQGSESAEQVAKDLGGDAQQVLELGLGFEEAYHQAMDHDFNTAQALAHLFELARAINRFNGHKKARKRGGPVVAPALAAFDRVAKSIGLMAMGSHDFQEEVKTKRLAALNISRDEVEALLAQRTEARANKDWSRADAIRDELDQKQIVVMDRPDGIEWRVRV